MLGLVVVLACLNAQDLLRSRMHQRSDSGEIHYVVFQFGKFSHFLQAW